MKKGPHQGPPFLIFGWEWNTTMSRLKLRRGKGGNMSDGRLDQIRESMNEKTTEELHQIWLENDTNTLVTGGDGGGWRMS